MVPISLELIYLVSDLLLALTISLLLLKDILSLGTFFDTPSRGRQFIINYKTLGMASLFSPFMFFCIDNIESDRLSCESVLNVHSLHQNSESVLECFTSNYIKDCLYLLHFDLFWLCIFLM